MLLFLRIPSLYLLFISPHHGTLGLMTQCLQSVSVSLKCYNQPKYHFIYVNCVYPASSLKDLGLGTSAS